MTKSDRYYRRIKPDRDDWRNTRPQLCMLCLSRRDGRLEVHEIERRSQSPARWASRCNYLLLCQSCHSKMDDAEWTHARQLALKRERDPDHFSLQAWLSIKPRPSTYVTLSEILKHIRGNGMPKREIKIEQIRWDATDLQARVRTDPGTVAAYAERMTEGVEFPPVVVFYDGEHYWPADGWHTAAAATKASFGTVPCDVRQGTREDAFDYALSANADHGLPRSNADKRKSVEMAIACERHAHLSDNAIAELCKVSHPFVKGIRSKVETFQPETRTGADGKQYPAKREKPAESGETDAQANPHNQPVPTPTDGRASVIRDTVPFKPDSPKRPAPFVDRFDQLFGPLVRFMDEAAEHFGHTGDHSHKSAMDHLNCVASIYMTKWRGPPDAAALPAENIQSVADTGGGGGANGSHDVSGRGT